MNRPLPSFRVFLIGSLIATALGFASTTNAQVGTTYGFIAQSGSYTAVSGGTTISGLVANDALSAAQNIGFNFVHDGVTYTQFKASSNGWLSLGAGATGNLATNNLATSSPGRPFLAPLWDDLSGAGGFLGAGAGTFRYVLSGSAPNRVLTAQWSGWKWDKNANLLFAVIDFQVKLYETTNVIEFVYSQGLLGSVSNTSGGASIGISGVGSGDYLSLNSTGASPTASNVTETSNLSSRPATGQIYRFLPCRPPVATASTAIDCVNGTYTASVNVTSLGSAPSVSLVSSVSGTFATNVGVGTYSAPAIANGTAQTLTVVHNGSNLCNITLGPVNSIGTCVTSGTCLSPTLAIPDNGCGSNNRVDAVVPITTTGTTLGTDVFLQSVDIIVAHIANSDVQVRLVSPTGQTRNLVLNRFGGVLNSNLGNPTSCPTSVLRLIDTGAPLTNTGTSNVTGNWAPEQTLAGFTGNPNGNWHLQVCDNGLLWTGSLNYVKLNFAPCLAPVATTTVIPNQAAGTYTVQVNVSYTGSGATVGLQSDLLGLEFPSVGTGTTVMGPYSLCSPVNITLKHASNALCDVTLPIIAPGTCITNNTCLSPTLAVPDNGCGSGNSLSAFINVTAPGTALNTDVLFQHMDLIVAHTWNSDLQVTLTSPTGQTRNMVLNRFGNGDNLGNPGTCPSTVFRLRDGGTALSNTNTSNVTGVYAPEQTLAGFTGNPNGYWKLTLCDNANLDFGSLVLTNLSFVAKGSTDPCAPLAIGCFASIDVNSTSGAPNTLPPSACGFNGPASTGGVHWWSYTASSNDDVTFSICNPSFDTRLSVFKPQPTCSNLVCVGGVDDMPGCGNGSEIKVKANIGDVFLVAVHGAGAAAGSYTIQTLCSSPICAQPANDLCAGATDLNPLPYVGFGTPISGDNTCAYVDGPTGNSGSDPVQGLWYTFNSGVNSKVRMTLTPGTASNLKWALHSGLCNGLDAFSEVANGNASGVTILNVTPATNYRLLVFNTGGPGVQGTFTLNMEVPGINDASISQVISPSGLLCDGQFQPVVKLKNLGEATLTSAQIIVKVDATVVNTINWTGPALASGDSVTLNLPLVTSTGNHVLSVNTNLPNGVADDIPTNDLASSAYQANGQTVKVRVTTDNNPGQTTWVIYDVFFFPVASGGPYVLPNTQSTITTCLSTDLGSQWYFFLFDSFGDGICCSQGSGSWQVLDRLDRVILRDNGQFTTQSPKTPPQTASYFAHEIKLPLGPSKPWTASPYNVCGVFNLGLQSKIRCTTVPGVTNYQWEFSNPDAGYRRVVSASTNFVTWTSMQVAPLQLGVTYLVRNRADQGTAGFNDDNYGEACELGWSNSTPFCTGLVSTPGATFSCGATRTWGGSSKVWATPVVGAFPWDANGDGDYLDAGDQAFAYHFRFTGPGAYVRDIYTANYICPLAWTTNPLVAGNTYQVQVEVQVGGTWRGFCGSTCNLTIAAGPGQGAGRVDAAMDAVENISLWPNPVRDGIVNLRVDGIADADQRITVDIYDAFGKKVVAQQYANSGSLFNTVLNLDGGMAAGVYMVNITINDRTSLKRLTVL